MNETFAIPGEVAAAISASRPELLNFATPRSLTEGEMVGLYQCIGQLIAENFRQRREIQQLMRREIATVAAGNEALEAARKALAAMRATLHCLTKSDDEEDC